MPMFSRLFVALQYLLPKYWLTSLVYRLARIRKPAVKNALIRGFLKLYDVRLDEVQGRVPEDFATFNDFFIRELEPGARPVDPDARAIVSPVDGTLSQAGAVHGIYWLPALDVEGDPELTAVTAMMRAWDGHLSADSPAATPSRLRSSKIKPAMAVIRAMKISDS